MLSLYKKINLLFLSCSLLVLVSNIVRGLLIGWDYLKILSDPSVFIFIVIIVFTIICTFIENKVLKIVQLIIVYLVAIASCIGAPFSFYGIGLWSIFIFLAYSYGFLDKHTRIKVYAYVSSVLFCFTCALLLQNLVDLTNITMIFYFLLYFAIHSITLFAVFQDKIKQYEKELENKMITSMLGERLSMVLHDSKNVLQKISASLYFLEDVNLSSEERTPYLNIINSSLTMINSKFESVLLANKESKDSFDLVPLLQGIIYLYELTPEGRKIKFNLEKTTESIIINGHKSDFFLLVDNIIKNAIEAKATAITLFADKDQRIILQVNDNGQGIAKCIDCENKHCLDCSISSTKKLGNGLGTRSIKDTIKKYKGTLLINSKEGNTIVTMLL